MKLNDLMYKSLQENLDETYVTSVKPIYDEGKVIKIIVEYTPRD